MRMIFAAIALPCLVSCAAAQPPALANEVNLPYSACGDMAALRSNLTGAPEPSPKSDAILRRLGVRCIGPREPQLRVRY
jgi:hypothetical protein